MKYKQMYASVYCHKVITTETAVVTYYRGHHQALLTASEINLKA